MLHTFTHTNWMKKRGESEREGESESREESSFFFSGCRFCKKKWFENGVCYALFYRTPITFAIFTCILVWLHCTVCECFCFGAGQRKPIRRIKNNNQRKREKKIIWIMMSLWFRIYVQHEWMNEHTMYIWMFGWTAGTKEVKKKNNEKQKWYLHIVESGKMVILCA